MGPELALAAAAALGALIGLSLALTGAGGGILAVPALVFGLHLSVSQAAPVGLLAVGAAAAAGALVGLRQGRVRYRAAAVIGGAGMLAAPFGMALARRVPGPGLTILFALVLAGVAVRMYRRTLRRRPSGDDATARALPPCVRDPATGRFVWTAPCARCLAATGLFAGALSGLLGVGGGFLIVPALTRHSDLAADAVVNTSLAVIALVSVSAVVSAASGGGLDWPVALPFAAGAMGALLLGQRCARRWSAATLQRCFALLSGAVAVLLFVRGVSAR